MLVRPIHRRNRSCDYILIVNQYIFVRLHSEIDPNGIWHRDILLHHGRCDNLGNRHTSFQVERMDRLHDHRYQISVTMTMMVHRNEYQLVDTFDMLKLNIHVL